jgi:HSP20 family protein
MIEVILKHDPVRRGWYTDENLLNHADEQRWRGIYRQHTWRPLTDVFENEESIVVRVEIGGMREEDFSVVLGEQHLIIEGNRADILERRAFYQLEIPYGEFSTEVDLPVPVATEGIEAVYRDGFLKIVLPKARSHLIKAKEL